MHDQISQKLTSILLASSLGVTACGSSEQIKSPRARSIGFEQNASDGYEEEDDIDSITGQKKGTALNADALNRAREIERVQQLIIQDTALKATALEGRAKLQVQIANVESKKITDDGGTAVGSGIAAGLLTALAITAGVMTGGIGFAIIPAVAAVGAGATAVGAGISSANTTAQVNKTVTQLKAELKTVELAITELDSRIERQKTMVQNLLKDNAGS